MIKLMKKDKMNLSYSKLTCLQDCPRRFLYEYILRLDAEPQAIDYGDLGSRAHLVLEDFYRCINIEVDNIEEEFNTTLGSLYHKHFDGITDHRGNMAAGVKNFCNREIKRYNSLEDKSIFMPRYNEIALEADIAGQHFRGRLDAVYINPDGSLKPVDYKFTGSNGVKVPQEIQAVIYIDMLEQQLNIECNDYFFWFMRHGMGPTGRGFEKMVNVTDDLKAKVYNIVEESAEIIEKGEFTMKPTFDFFCTNLCGYQGICLSEML